MRWLRATTEASEDRGPLAPIRIFTAELELDGFVAPSGQRITDILLRGQDLPFLPAAADPVPDNWISISPTEILIASPPPLPQRAPMRVSREKHRVSFRVGRYAVSGTAYVRPEADGSTQAILRQPFVPVTDAELIREGHEWREGYAVLIVNVARATSPTFENRVGAAR